MSRRHRSYAKTIRHVSFAGSRIERIFVIDELRESNRFSHVMGDGRTCLLAPFNMPEGEFLILLGDAIAARVFLRLAQLKDVVESQV